MGESSVSWQYLLSLSQFKVSGLQDPAGAFFINVARHRRPSILALEIFPSVNGLFLTMWVSLGALVSCCLSHNKPTCTQSTSV